MNKTTKYYKVGGHVFGVTATDSDFELMANYSPFACNDADVLFWLSVIDDDKPAYAEETRQEEEGQEIICGHTAEDQPVFEFRWWNKTAGCLVCSPDYHEAQLIVTGEQRKMAVDNALMVLYALATAPLHTALFHAAVVSYHDAAYMFLGKSGTGKSTHASLWLRYIKGTNLVNDDNPVVRIGTAGQATVYGSPWSGKTPCYRNVQYPLGGIVQLSQAPYNKIGRLKGIEAYAALVPSISGKRWDRHIADGLHKTEDQLATLVPTWHLECLPDEDAAQLCNKTITLKPSYRD